MVDWKYPKNSEFPPIGVDLLCYNNDPEEIVTYYIGMYNMIDNDPIWWAKYGDDVIEIVPTAWAYIDRPDGEI